MSRIFDVSCDGYPAFRCLAYFSFLPPACSYRDFKTKATVPSFPSLGKPSSDLDAGEMISLRTVFTLRTYSNVSAAARHTR